MSAYTSLPVEKVLDWCNTTIFAIEKRRKKLMEERITEYQKPKTFFGITVSKGMTKEEAKNHLLNNGNISDFMITNAYYIQYSKVQLLKKLCLAAKASSVDKIEVSADDLDNLIIT